MASTTYSLSTCLLMSLKFIISSENHSSKQFFEILCYDKPRNWFIWHSPCESRHHSASENVCHTNIRKVCLNYKFCTMWHLDTKYANFQEKISAEISGTKFQSFHCSNVTTTKSLGIFLRNSVKVYSKKGPQHRRM